MLLLSYAQVVPVWVLSAAVLSPRVLAGARAQSTIALPTGWPSVDEACILACTEQSALKNGCGSSENLSCVCASSAYWLGALGCMYSNCTAQDIQLATDLQQDQCLYLTYDPNPTSLSSAASRFSSVASSVALSESSVLSSLSSAYPSPSQGPALSSVLSSYASSLSAALSSDALSVAGVAPQSNAAAGTSSSSSAATSSNPAGGMRIEGASYRGGIVAAFALVMGALMGAVLAF